MNFPGIHAVLRNLIVMLAAILLAACGARGFKKEGASHDEFMTDLRQCLYEAKVPANGCFYPGAAFCKQDTYRNACMERKGWSITRDEGRYQIP
jgi:hypothetical protein